MNDQVTVVAEAYRAFARREARGRSAEYESLAESVADDPAVVGFIALLPPDKRQPNLLFAAARYLLDVPLGIQQLRDLIIQSRPELTRVILTRRTQTNEPARCAVLLPAAMEAMDRSRPGIRRARLDRGRQSPDGSSPGGAGSWRRRTSTTCTPNAWNLARSPFRAP